MDCPENLEKSTQLTLDKVPVGGTASLLRPTVALRVNMEGSDIPHDYTISSIAHLISLCETIKCVVTRIDPGEVVMTLDNVTIVMAIVSIDDTVYWIPSPSIQEVDMVYYSEQE